MSIPNSRDKTQTFSHYSPKLLVTYSHKDSSVSLINSMVPSSKSVSEDEDFDTEEEKPVKSFEEILKDLGCFGPFQVLVLFSYLFMEIAAAFVVFIPVFVGKTISVPNCTTETTDPAELVLVGQDKANLLSSESSSWTTILSLSSLLGLLESSFKYESLVDEWDLKCDRSWIPDAFTSCLMAGMIVGNVIASQMCDWYGRRKTYIAILVVLCIGTILSAFSPNIYFYALAQFITGSAFCGFINVSCMAVMEFMTTEWRSLANMAGPMGEGIILLSLLGYHIRPWRLLYIATLTPYVLIVPIYYLIPESPRWLLRNDRVSEAHDVLNYMAKVNGRHPVSMHVLEALKEQEISATKEQTAKRVSYPDFLKNRQLLVTSIYLFAVWFAWNVAYYGISYNMRNVPGSPYYNLGLVGVANVVGQRVSMPASDRCGRRSAVLYGMTLSAIPLVILAVWFLFVDEVSPDLILVGCLIAILGLSCTRAATRLLSGESFPTAVRTMGLAVGGLGANVAGLVTPQVAYLGTRWPSVPYFIFAVVAIVGSLVVFMMKETNGEPLPDEVHLNRSTSKRAILQEEESSV